MKHKSLSDQIAEVNSTRIVIGVGIGLIILGILGFALKQNMDTRSKAYREQPTHIGSKKSANDTTSGISSGNACYDGCAKIINSVDRQSCLAGCGLTPGKQITPDDGGNDPNYKPEKFPLGPPEHIGNAPLENGFAPH